jgi:hypothetical protein
MPPQGILPNNERRERRFLLGLNAEVSTPRKLMIYDHLPIPPLDGVGIVYPQPPEASSAGGFPL